MSIIHDDMKKDTKDSDMSDYSDNSGGHMSECSIEIFHKDYQVFMSN